MSSKNTKIGHMQKKKSNVLKKRKDWTYVEYMINNVL